MKQYLLLISLLFLPPVVFSETTRKVDMEGQNVIATYMSDDKEVAKEVFGSGGKLLQKEGIIPDGTVRQYSYDGKITGEWHYKDGKRDGVVKRYYDNGKLKLEANYKGGVRHGMTKGYFAAGGLAAEDMYAFGQLNGVSKVYLVNGNLFCEINYVSGVREGLTKTYYGNGTLGELANYKNGKRDGTLKTYYADAPSKIESEFTYKNSELIGSKSYSIDGKLKSGQK